MAKIRPINHRRLKLVSKTFEVIGAHVDSLLWTVYFPIRFLHPMWPANWSTSIFHDFYKNQKNTLNELSAYNMFPILNGFFELETEFLNNQYLI